MVSGLSNSEIPNLVKFPQRKNESNLFYSLIST